MKKTIADLLSSKKFLAALATIAGLILAKGLGWDISEDTLATVLGAVGAIYIAAQGAADHGKEATKIAAESRAAESDPGNG